MNGVAAGGIGSFLCKSTTFYKPSTIQAEIQASNYATYGELICDVLHGVGSLHTLGTGILATKSCMW
eukprot:CAMPEP_0114236762 /NCGR_PEP_ID=MMETSP0058-20121206/7024_1 /TAXON_ID=36894 /ORGANISM="Pyramimonas parkeae, CCMP726" /LENGTH=66 /DNA_ID=CAMNT_0001348747 /DNA_START=195 /DNA_END=392 /DNA_ORIENTATION=-